jgi:hypothetical protein
MSVKIKYGDFVPLLNKEFSPVSSLSDDQLIQEFLYVSKIHRYEKLWLRDCRKQPCGAERCYGYSEAMKIIPLYGFRKFALRNEIRNRDILADLYINIRIENTTSGNI